LRNRTAYHQPKSGNDAYDGLLVAETLSGLGVAARLCDRGFVPHPACPPANASHYFEHLAIFLATGFAFGMDYPDEPFAWATRLILFCSVIEIAQHWDPGRHARLSDFVVDAMAACTGLGIAFATMSVISNSLFSS
jgi:hypothetical protein